MTVYAVPAEVAQNRDRLDAWLAGLSIVDLADTVEAGYLSTETISDDAYGPLSPVRQSVEREIQRRHAHRTLQAQLDRLDQSGFGVAMFLPGVDDLQSALAYLAPKVPVDGEDPPDGPETWAVDATLAGDVLCVRGITSDRVAEALRATRPLIPPTADPTDPAFAGAPSVPTRG